MGNAFESANYPTTEPAVIIAGDRLTWKRTDLGNDYPPASYTLSYTARRHGTSGADSDTFSITASEDGTDYVVEVGQATTAAYDVGDYDWQMYMTRDSDSERVTLDYGTWEVAANRATSTTDPRTHAKIVLDAIEAVIEGRASKDQENYSIAGRSLVRTPLAELYAMRRKYAYEVQQELAAERIRNGGADGTKVQMRFRQ